MNTTRKHFIMKDKAKLRSISDKELVSTYKHFILLLRRGFILMDNNHLEYMQMLVYQIDSRNLNSLTTIQYGNYNGK